MTIKKLILFALAIITTLIIYSCNSKEAQDEFHQACDRSNKLVFKRYDLGGDSAAIQNLDIVVMQDLDNVVWTNTITDVEKIKKFNHLFSSVKDHGYCCCVKTHYTVSFYKNDTELGLYFIDTTDMKDKVVLFGKSFQTSYIIELKDLQTVVLDK